MLKWINPEMKNSLFPSFLLPLSSLQVWVCWFQRGLFLMVGCMRCMWLCTGRTAWGKFSLSISLSLLLCGCFLFLSFVPCCPTFFFLFISESPSVSCSSSLFYFVCSSLFFFSWIATSKNCLYSFMWSLSQYDMGLRCTERDEYSYFS